MNSEQKPHRLRWWILLLLFLAMTINILDRQVLSLVAPVIRDEFRLSNTQYGTIVFCFLLGMTLAQIPVGMMMDRYGARIGFSLVIAWWSAANMLHAGARTVAQFSLLRFLLGVGECGTYSAGVKAIGQWFPAKERALAAGLFNSGSLAGAVIAPPLIVYLMLHHGWPSAFLIPSLAGFVWIVPWLRLYWEPWRHPRLTQAEREAARPAVREEASVSPSIGRLLALRPVWGVILMRAFGGPVTHFYWYWLPEYLKRERGMSLEMIGLFAWLPFFSGGAGNIGGGWFSSRLIARGWTVHKARKTALVISVALCLSAVLVPAAPNAAWALALICLASLGINAVAANLMGLITDLFPQRVLARVSGMTGVGDGAMSMTMMQLTGIVVDRYSYLPVFVAAGVFPLMSLASLLLLVGKIRPVEFSNPK
ncbi:MAG: MFS transporter [Bryobacteraceae bacterium]